MTEKQKMLHGEFYNPRDPELLEDYHRARHLLRALSQLDSRALDQRTALFRDLLGHAGDGAWIELPFSCEYGRHITIGRNSFVNVQCVFSDCNAISIGDHTLIGPNCQIYTATHPLDAADRIVPPAPGQAPYRTQTRPVRIGDNVWLGGSVIVLPGVTIGNNTTIGAGSVVTKDIPENVLAFGNPCRVIRSISSSNPTHEPRTLSP